MRERTDLAEERTLLARERTFAAWTRTSLTAIAVGLAIDQLLPDVKRVWLARVVGLLLIGAGTLMQGMGLWYYRKTFRKLSGLAGRGPSLWVVGLLATVVMLCGVGGILLLLL